jgi:hypothetical protein
MDILEIYTAYFSAHPASNVVETDSQIFYPQEWIACKLHSKACQLYYRCVSGGHHPPVPPAADLHLQREE